MLDRFTTKGKFVLGAILVIAIGFGLWYATNKTNLSKTLAPSKNTSSQTYTEGPNGEKVVRTSVNTWGGFAGGWLYNKGFKASTESRFFKEQGIMVDFKLQDDFNASRESWKADEVDLLWSTIDCFSIESEALKEFDPVVLFQVDWSRGGDAIVVRRGINNVNDLKGKTIALAPMTPSNTFLVWLLESSNLTYNDIQVIEVSNALDAAQMFKDGKVDACICWSPDDQDCVAQVSGSKVLQSTKDASHIIADVFIAKRKWVEANKDVVGKFIKGWFIGSSEVNTSDKAKQEAAQIMSDGVNQPLDFCMTAIENAKITTLGDNVNFFNINGNYSGVTGEQVYAKMTLAYKNLKYIKNNSLPWKQIAYTYFIKNSDLKGKTQEAENEPVFTAPTKDMETVEAMSTKSLTINFATNSYVLDDNAKYIIDNTFVPIAKGYKNSRVRIEGNTDNTGNRSRNMELSRQRAQAVADYLIREHGWNPNRFIIVGNGPDKPVDPSNTNSESARSKNRRTDFELVKN